MTKLGASLRARKAPRGQAAVESVIVFNLVLFLILGILQLQLIQNARALTEYAAFNAVRAGAVGYGSCDAMAHAAAATLMPAVETFTRTSPPSAGLANAFGARLIAGSVFKYQPALDDGHDGTIFWMRRVRPLKADVDLLPAPQADEWDDPEATQPNFHLEVQVTFFFPMKIPFANWVLARIAMAQWGLLPYLEKNPIVINGQTTDWSDNPSTPTFSAAVGAELVTRTNAGHYTFPLQGSSTMRMMVPVKKSFFLAQDCVP